MNKDKNFEEEKEYQDALNFLFSQLPMFSRVGAPAYKPGLETSEQLDAFFGHPHRKYKTIHIGGTNGKGSTSHSLASVLQQQGYKTALYTSPHLIDFRERMRVNGKMIPKREVIDFTKKWRETAYQGHPSFFELTMMMAFDWFAREEVDFAIIEVGMGGRLDSTNIISPELCVITNISNDHSQFLGNTLEAIAGEKAGIIKEMIPVVIGEAEGSVRKIFEDKAASTNSPITFSEDSPLLEYIGEKEDVLVCKIKAGSFTFPLSGDYQKKNIETILHAVEGMRNIGISISDESVMSGLENVVENTGIMGRWMRIKNSPLAIADTGHNIAGIEYNMRQLDRLMKKHPGGKLRIVIGFVADKTIDKIVKLLPPDAEYYITNASIPRALPADDLKKVFDTSGLPGKVYPDVETAYEAALRESDENDIIFVGGSTFIVADLLTTLNP